MIRIDCAIKGAYALQIVLCTLLNLQMICFVNWWINNNVTVIMCLLLLVHRPNECCDVLFQEVVP